MTTEPSENASYEGRAGQAQSSLSDQMVRLRRLAITNGLYDADEWLVRMYPWPERFQNCEDICMDECIGACGA